MSSRIDYTKSNPCPVCGSGSKGCNGRSDGFQLCRGEPKPGWVCVAPVTANGEHKGYRREDDNRRGRWRGERSSRDGLAQRSGEKSARPLSPAWDIEARRYADNLTPDLRDELESRLGLPQDAFDAVPLLGYCHVPVVLIDGVRADPSHWTIPETDAAGRVIGIERRHRREYAEALDQSEKRSVLGGSRGLILPDGWRDRPGPTLNVEGATCCVAAHAAGLSVTSRPGSRAGLAHLAVLYKNFPADRDIIIVGENDRKADGKWPGKEGAIALATELADKLRRRVLWSLPPEGAKDSREYLRDSHDWQDTPWADRGREYLAHLVAVAVAVEPPPEADPCPELATCDYKPDRDDDSDCGGDGVSGLARLSSHAGRSPGNPKAENSPLEIPGEAARKGPSPEVLAIIGVRPTYIPCKYAQTNFREGMHNSTLGHLDFFLKKCGRCKACQDQIRYDEKVVHVTAALAVGTHVMYEEDAKHWDRVRKRLQYIRKKQGLPEAFPFARCIQAGTSRFVVMNPGLAAELIPDDLGLIETPAEQCAKLMCGAIDNIPWKLKKGTHRIPCNALWRDAAGVVKEKKERPAEQLYTEAVPVEMLEDDDYDRVEGVAIEHGADVSRAPLKSKWIIDRIVVIPAPETEHEVFRAICKGSLAAARRAIANRLVLRREKAERRRREREWEIEAESITRDLRRQYAGREHEARGVIAFILAC
jgi:hypothetical protein